MLRQRKEAVNRRREINSVTRRAVAKVTVVTACCVTISRHPATNLSISTANATASLLK